MDEEGLVLADVKLRWFDDSTLLTDNPERLLECSLRSLGVHSKTGFDVFRVLLASHKAGLKVSAKEVHAQVEALRARRGDRDRKGLTLRNIQVWLKFYQDLGFLENIHDKYMFRAAKNPSDCFNEYTAPIIDSSIAYTRRALSKMEEALGI